MRSIWRRLIAKAGRPEVTGDERGYCQPGQIMSAVALVKRIQSEVRKLTEGDLDSIRNICRCGTYFRIREAIVTGAKNM